MNSNNLIVIPALLFSFVTFAQKDQIKAAEKALKAGNSQEALTVLQTAESLISAAPDTEKAQYFFVKGNALLDLANKKIDVKNNLSLASIAYRDLLGIEKTSGKDKFSSQAQTSIADIKSKIINLAIDKSAEKKFKEASSLLFQAYELDKSDLEKLYFAASYAINDKDYDLSLKYYQELKNYNYTGEATQYYAKNLVTEKEDFFGTTPSAKADRDSRVKLKIYSEPRDEKSPSRRPEINKNIALILTEKGKIAEAKVAFEEAIKESPDNVSLILLESELYYKENDMVMYKKLITSALEKNPDNAELIYNLGVASHKNKEYADAEKFYKQAISTNPNYSVAYLNLANLKLDGRNKIVDEMNKLGASAVDMKKYDYLKKQSENILLTEVLPLLEKAYTIDSVNEDIKYLLIKVYKTLDMKEKANAVK
ncbi:tetratricopeptide repeat protein [Flavobacterium sp.]|uniref:tetratricopeptide repeat protein n=1 Tax=Flavobacterium sp. TaxID=239 RepID=UPI0038FD3991